jgi:hypothetical protein
VTNSKPARVQCRWVKPGGIPRPRRGMDHCGRSRLADPLRVERDTWRPGVEQGGSGTPATGTCDLRDAAFGHVVKLVKFPAFRPYIRARIPARLRRKRIEVHQLHHALPTVQSGRTRHAAISTPCRAMTRSPGRWARGIDRAGIAEHRKG